MPPSETLDRRRLLQLAASGAAVLCWPRSWSQQRFASDPFALGVASGAPAHDSVVLWTRLVATSAFDSLGSQPIAVRWEVAHDEAFTRIVQRGQSQAAAELAHSVHVEVQGLEADRWYHYRFMAGAAVSAIGRTRTLPAPDAQVAKLRLAYASCQRWEHGYYSAWRHMRADQPDAVMFLGDYIYESPRAWGAVRLPTGGWVQTLDEYRQRYALHKSDADLQAMHAACPWLVTWDDHEVQNDYAGLRAGSGGPPLNLVPDFAARRVGAYQAYYEHMPLRSSTLARLYARYRWGKLATLHVLDARQHKDAHACGPEGKAGSSYFDPAACPAWRDPQRSMLGRAQEQWLDASLAQGGSTWTVIGQQTVFGQRDARSGPGQSFWNDGWDGYPAARTRLTESLRRHTVTNAVLLGGDVHENWVGHVKADYDREGSPVLGVEFCGTSITSRQSAGSRTAERLAENPHFLFADSERRGYGLADFTPGQLTTTLRVVDDVTRRDSGVQTLARFTVPAGQPRVERV